jgi:hypothetical protein
MRVWVFHLAGFHSTREISIPRHRASARAAVGLGAWERARLQQTRRKIKMRLSSLLLSLAMSFGTNV